MKRPDFVGWLRNIDRRDWALTVSYEDHGGDVRPFYPDFLVVRRGSNGLEVDLLDPHNPLLADSVAKARGLAHFAAKYGFSFGRIELIAVEDNQIKRINLKDDAQCQAVFSVSDGRHLLSLFR
jgi:type III restriction enzyme